ncbi:MAG: hypothetical protein ACYDG4_13240 [Desulfuromonadaceae bacterium]
MTWANSNTRMRRFLRDPDKKIWSDPILLSLFNDVQKEIQIKTNFLEDVREVHVPPLYDMSYLQDWEWAFLSSQTGNYQALKFHQQAEIAFCYRWEPQAVWGLVDATETDEGSHCTHPFEYFMVGTPGDIVPLQLPPGFHNAKFVAWDREPIDPLTRKAISQDDPSWASRTGIPFGYWRPDQLDDTFCLYPLPSSVTWEDVAGEGMVISTEGGTESSEYGAIIDAGTMMSGGEYGIVTDVIETENTALFVYTKQPTALVDVNDESDFPAYLQKYIEHGTLERAYVVDNDGKIQSLREYWAMRKDLGLKAIRRFQSLRTQDRDYRLTTKGAPGFRTRRQPRLPDSYPAVM